jgi:predicted GNAT family acetyltransferase
MTEISYGFSIEGVNWEELKADLKADDFDNGRTPEQYRLSAENSYLNCFARVDGKIIGNLRVLSDGVCNAYIVDVWTHSAYRRRGVATRMLESALAKLEGQHVCLFTDSMMALYEKVGFKREEVGMSRVVGKWLQKATRNSQ